MDSPEPDAARSDALHAALKLALVPGVGPLTRRSLIDRFGSAEAVFQAAPSQLREVPKVGPKLCREIVEANRSIDAAAFL